MKIMQGFLNDFSPLLYYFPVPRAQENELKLAKNIEGKKKGKYLLSLKNTKQRFPASPQQNGPHCRTSLAFGMTVSSSIFNSQ